MTISAGLYIGTSEANWTVKTSGPQCFICADVSLQWKKNLSISLVCNCVFRGAEVRKLLSLFFCECTGHPQVSNIV